MNRMALLVGEMRIVGGREHFYIVSVVDEFSHCAGRKPALRELSCQSHRRKNDKNKANAK
jgi:hypothetical protein